MVITFCIEIKDKKKQIIKELPDGKKEYTQKHAFLSYSVENLFGTFDS